MSDTLAVSIGQYSTPGRKPENQDFHGAVCPPEPALGIRGIAVALADGISSSSVSREAAESAVKTFLDDYYCTSDAWSVRTAGQKVLQAINSWLHAQTRRSQHRYDRDKGYVCTFSALILKSNTAHVLHVGDTRVYRLRGGDLEQLTKDHRVFVSQEQSYLARALGIDDRLEIEYLALEVERGDVFLLVTDGVYEYQSPRDLVRLVEENTDDLQQAARTIADGALAAGSADNLTVQLVRVDQLPTPHLDEIQRQAADLPLPPLLEPRMHFDGYEILRQLHGNSRSQIFLARDGDSQGLVALKVPSLDLRDDPVYLERFLTEEWIARRIDNVHVLKPFRRERPQSYLYLAMEYVEGSTLTQWMLDHPEPDLATVRAIVEQIARGLQAFHRLEMLHQDLRPDNVLIDATGTVKLIDFGSTCVAGLAEIVPDDGQVLGTVQYGAPEYFRGEPGTVRSELYSLGVITYQLLTGVLPYGAAMARAQTRSAQRKVPYRPARDGGRRIPPWVDEALRKAVHPLPEKRQEAISEFLMDLRRPNPQFLRRARSPLIERNPVAFWKGTSLMLLLIVLVLVHQLQVAR